MTDNRKVTINFSLKRVIGEDELHFTVSDFTEHDNIRSSYNRIFPEVSKAVEDWLQDYAPRIMSTPRTPTGAGEWYAISEFSVTLTDGKRRVYAKCGKWSKHGLMVFDEKAKAIGLNLSDIPDTGYKPKKTVEAFVTCDTQGRYRIDALRVVSNDGSGS